MRNMSFALTKKATIQRSKFVTRRLGWKNLKVGELFKGVEKGQGLKRGEHPVVLGTMRCDANETQPLDSMVRANNRSECILEGFPEMSPVDFVEMFCAHNKCEQFTPIQRIQFSYVIDTSNGIEEHEHLLTPGRELQWGEGGDLFTARLLSYKPFVVTIPGHPKGGTIFRDYVKRIFISA